MPLEFTEPATVSRQVLDALEEVAETARRYRSLQRALGVFAVTPADLDQAKAAVDEALARLEAQR